MAPSHGKCRRIKYTRFADDKELLNHTIAVIGWTVNDLSLCMAKCFQETQDCVSFNFCSTPNGWKECRLLNSSHFKNESFLVERKGCEYYTSESTCSSSPCVKNATCIPHMPRDPKPYSCICPEGFKGQSCHIDINECAQSGICHVNATCTNMPGKYNCTCKLGFQGDGNQCKDIDECTTGSHTCHAQATCHNTAGSYSCYCKLGYTGDGKSCSPFDPACSGYSNLTDQTRNVNSGVASPPKCDTAIGESTWYRFLSPAGVRMPTSCTPADRCGATATGWLNGQHPTVEQGVVDRTVCFNWNSNCCFGQKTIKVRNCAGGFYTYKFKRVNPCLRYCATN
ncbi:Uromodulin [Exaiptasia diaphana]|nr:Uromodulin [Exaiptasia diaphana]